MAGKPRTTRNLAALLTAAPLLLAAACGDDGDAGSDAETVTPDELEAIAPEGFAATPGYVRAVAERSSTEPHRFEMWMAFGGEPDTTRPPFASGEEVDQEFAGEVDLGRFMRDLSEQVGELLPPEFAGMDMTMEMAGDATSVYMRVPFFAEMARDFAPLGDPAAEIFALFDDWVYIDETRLTGTALEELQAAIGNQSFDPKELLDILATAEGARELEPIEVRGNPMVGIAAEVSYSDLAEAQGVDIEELRSAVPEVSDDEFATIMDLTTDISTWIDGDGYIGRMGMTMDLREVAEVDDELDPQGLDEFVDVVGGTDVTIVMDLFDYGDPAINVELPTDATDITDDVHLLEGF